MRAYINTTIANGSEENVTEANGSAESFSTTRSMNVRSAVATHARGRLRRIERKPTAPARKPKSIVAGTNGRIKRFAGKETSEKMPVV